jgi:5'-3' exonuclease
MTKLLAIDGLSVLRPIFEANAEPDLRKRAQDALDSAVSSFGRLIGTHFPSHVLAAFDAGGHTWRHSLYPRYRENRMPMATELRDRIPDFLATLEKMGMRPLRVEGVEADDVIATGVTRWLAEGRGEAIVATSDKDLHQLIEFGAVVCDPFERGEMRDAAWVQKKFGVRPEQLADYFALMGDAVDGVPGVPGIGKKKAAELLHRYGRIDGVMAGAGLLLDTTGKALRGNKADLYLSRQLVALKTDVTLGVTWKMLAMPAAH